MRAPLAVKETGSLPPAIVPQHSPQREGGRSLSPLQQAAGTIKVGGHSSPEVILYTRDKETPYIIL